MPARTTLSRIYEIAEEQWGLITRAQAQRSGIPPRTFARLAAGDSFLRRVARGTYQLNGTPTPDHIDLRAAWLQLAPTKPAWTRTAQDGVVSHRSAAALYGLGHLPADRHEFTVRARRQSRRADVRLYRAELAEEDVARVLGLPVTRPSRIVFDLLTESEEPDAVANVMADALREEIERPAALVDALAPHAIRLGFRRGDGFALMQSLLDLIPDAERSRWLEAARSHSNAAISQGHRTTRKARHPMR